VRRDRAGAGGSACDTGAPVPWHAVDVRSRGLSNARKSSGQLLVTRLYARLALFRNRSRQYVGIE